MVFIPTLPHQSGPVLGTDDTLTQSPLAFLSKTHSATLRENNRVSEVGGGEGSEHRHIYNYSHSCVCLRQTATIKGSPD